MKDKQKISESSSGNTRCNGTTIIKINIKIYNIINLVPGVKMSFTITDEKPIEESGMAIEHTNSVLSVVDVFEDMGYLTDE